MKITQGNRIEKNENAETSGRTKTSIIQKESLGLGAQMAYATALDFLLLCFIL
jgi:hypothetical protein